MSLYRLRSDLDISLSACVASFVKSPHSLSFYLDRAFAILDFATFSGIISYEEYSYLSRAINSAFGCIFAE